MGSARPALEVCSLGRGQPVREGQRVGELGCAGSCFGDHLHFEIRRGRSLEGAPLDPLPDLKRWAGSPGQPEATGVLSAAPARGTRCLP